MGRTTPIPVPDSLEPRKDSGIITQVREYKLITPLFGGGVEPGEADPVTVIRASEIRGHLRFWWRATRGGQFDGDLTKMKAAEDALWGAASSKERGGPSLVEVDVEVIDRGRPEVVYAVNRYSNNGQPVADHQKQSRTPGYASFPLQPERNETEIGWKSKPVVLDIVFRLTLRFPASVKANQERQFQTEIESALWAWETFGGIGARTRRGFGAVHCFCIDNQPPQDLPNATHREYADWIARHVADCTGTWPDNVPHLSSNTLFAVTAAKTNVTTVWNDLITRFKDFRGQHESTPFRKRDLAAIKRLVRDNPKPETIQDFQRAALGLPLIYQNLKGVSVKSVTLRGKSNEQLRFASPLILRPMLCKDGNYVAIAVLLAGSHLPEQLTLDGYKDATIDTSGADDLGVTEAFINSLKGAK